MAMVDVCQLTVKLEEAGRRQAEAERKLTEAHRSQLAEIVMQQRAELERLAEEHESALRWLEDRHRHDTQLHQDTSVSDCVSVL